MKHIIIKKVSFILLGFALVTSLISCDNDDDAVADASGILVEDLTGNWYVKLLVNGDDIYHLGYYNLTTYNTGNNSGTQMWLDDHELWPMKVKANVDLSALTISGTDLENEYSYTSGGVTVTPSVTITDGKIYTNGSVAPSGTVTDSISLNVEFADDPGTIYQIAGYKSTGKVQDLQ